MTAIDKHTSLLLNCVEFYSTGPRFFVWLLFTFEIKVFLCKKWKRIKLADSKDPSPATLPKLDAMFGSTKFYKLVKNDLRVWDTTSKSKSCRKGSFASNVSQGKSTYTFSAECLHISTFRSPARWLYPLKPGGEWKAEDVWWKMYTLIYPDPPVYYYCKCNTL